MCGGAFRWPTLTPNEIHEMLRLGSIPFRGPKGITTWLESFERETLEVDMLPDLAGVNRKDLFEVRSLFHSGLSAITHVRWRDNRLDAHRFL